jgi:hypothetical protein
MSNQDQLPVSAVRYDLGGRGNDMNKNLWVMTFGLAVLAAMISFAGTKLWIATQMALWLTVLAAMLGCGGLVVYFVGRLAVRQINKLIPLRGA